MGRTLGFAVSDEEHAAIRAEADALGISVSLYLYRQVFDKPNAFKRSGRPAKERPTKETRNDNQDGLWAMTG